MWDRGTRLLEKMSFKQQQQQETLKGIEKKDVILGLERNDYL